MIHRASCHLTVLALSIVLAGCGSSDRPAPAEWSGSTDTLSSGRIVVHNPDVPGWGDTRIVLQERVRLGTLDGGGPELFGQIAGIELGADGEIYVLDGRASEIRVFGAEGAFQRILGREGEGPGELSGPGGLALDSEGTLWVLNWGNSRYTGFDPATGDVRNEVRRLLSFRTVPWQGAFENGVRLLDVGLDSDGQPSILRLDTAFVPQDALPLPQVSDDDRVPFRNGFGIVGALLDPFAPQAMWAPRPSGGIVLGEGAEYRLHRIGFDRDTSMTIELEREPGLVTAAERDSALVFFQEMAASLRPATPDRRPRVRSTKPAHGSLFVDDQDRTWVSALTPIMRDWVAYYPPGTGLFWDVFSAEGMFLGQVEMLDPPGYIRPVIRNDRMVVATLIDGYPTVVVYDLVEVGR